MPAQAFEAEEIGIAAVYFRLIVSVYEQIDVRQDHDPPPCLCRLFGLWIAFRYPFDLLGKNLPLFCDR